MKRVLVLPFMVVMLLSFSSFAESTKSTANVGNTATIQNSSKSRVAITKSRQVKEKSGNWSKIKSLFL